MDKSENTSLRFSKLWIIGLVSIVTLIGLGLVLFTINLSLIERTVSESIDCTMSRDPLLSL